MEFPEILLWYYKGERNEALWLAALGIVILIIGLGFWSKSDWLNGLAIVFLLWGTFGWVCTSTFLDLYH